MKTNFLIRSDIVLLRAVAVLLVICYHFFPNIIDFGYLGVDVFLVISGYLMVSSYSSSKNGLHFIVKRAYRLLPALLSVGIICYLLIYVLLRDDLIYEFYRFVQFTAFGAIWQHGQYFSGAGQCCAYNSGNCQKRSKIKKREHFFQRPNLGNFGQLVGLEASRPLIGGSGGRSPPGKREVTFCTSVQIRIFVSSQWSACPRTPHENCWAELWLVN